MINYIIVVLVFSFSSSVFAVDKTFNGFGKIKWGESIKKYKKVMQLKSDNTNPEKYYVRKNDVMFLDDISLTSITYVFYKGKFSSAIIQTDKLATNSKQIVNIFKKKYGKPYYKNMYTNKFLWKDTANAVALKCYSSSHKCSAIYNSVVMSDLKKADNKAAVKK